LTAAIGGAAAAAAASVVRVAPVQASHDPFQLGHGNATSAATSLTLTAVPAVGYGLNITVPDDARALDVATQVGVGIRATANAGGGVAVQASAAATGYALHTKGGRLKLARISGVATIKKGKKSVVVKPGVVVTGEMFVLLTPKANIGSRALWFTNKPATDRFIIHMSSARGSATKVAWLAAERA